jgi:hypothetical protein
LIEEGEDLAKRKDLMVKQLVLIQQNVIDWEGRVSDCKPRDLHCKVTNPNEQLASG